MKLPLKTDSSIPTIRLFIYPPGRAGGSGSLRWGARGQEAVQSHRTPAGGGFRVRSSTGLTPESTALHLAL